MDLKEAIKKSECVDIDYGDRTPEEIKELDEALDVVFAVARRVANANQTTCDYCGQTIELRKKVTINLRTRTPKTACESCFAKMEKAATEYQAIEMYHPEKDQHEQE